MILDKDGQAFGKRWTEGAGGVDIQKPQGFDWDEEGSSLSNSEAGFQVLRYMCDELLQLFPSCNCVPQVSEKVINYWYAPAPHMYK